MSTTHTELPAPAPGTPGTALTRTRRRLLLAAGAVLLVAALVAVLLGIGGNDGDPSPAGAGSETPAPTSAEAPVTVAPPVAPLPDEVGASPNADELPPALPAVALDAPAQVGNGIVVTVSSVEAIEGAAEGPGNVAGPALRVTIRITNGTDEAVSLDGVAVTMAYGTEGTPASPLDDASRRPFAGSVAPGEEADGTYVFTVPADARGTVTIEVGYQPGAPRLLFTGPAA